MRWRLNRRHGGGVKKLSGLVEDPAGVVEPWRVWGRLPCRTSLEILC